MRENCIKRWKLQPPYEPLSDAEWTAYFQERAALEFRHLVAAAPENEEVHIQAATPHL